LQLLPSFLQFGFPGGQVFEPHFVVSVSPGHEYASTVPLIANTVAKPKIMVLSLLMDIEVSSETLKNNRPAQP
jgi:hypothetical protein